VSSLYYTLSSKLKQLELKKREEEQDTSSTGWFFSLLFIYKNRPVLSSAQSPSGAETLSTLREEKRWR
jgi:hypothetical protein